MGNHLIIFTHFKELKFYNQVKNAEHLCYKKCMVREGGLTMKSKTYCMLVPCQAVISDMRQEAFFTIFLVSVVEIIKQKHTFMNCIYSLLLVRLLQFR